MTGARHSLGVCWDRWQGGEITITGGAAPLRVTGAGGEPELLLPGPVCQVEAAVAEGLVAVGRWKRRRQQAEQDSEGRSWKVLGNVKVGPGFPKAPSRLAVQLPPSAPSFSSKENKRDDKKEEVMAQHAREFTATCTSAAATEPAWEQTCMSK